MAVEYSREHERAGSIRMYETLPLFSGRSTLEGVYNQASLQTHAVYYLASELGETLAQPVPQPRVLALRRRGRARAPAPVQRVRDRGAQPASCVRALQARSDVAAGPRIPPYSVFRLRDPGPGYVEPMAYEPVRSSPRGWRDKAYRWFTRKPLSPAHLVFTDDRASSSPSRTSGCPRRCGPSGRPSRSLGAVEPEAITITTSRPGHPLLVKVSYHPRWRAEGADGPFLTSPALMTVVPRQREVRLTYARTWADGLGSLLTLAALGLGAWRLARRLPWLRARRPQPAPAEGGAVAAAVAACEGTPVPRRWGGVVPAALLLALAGSRLLASVPGVEGDPRALYERASRAYAEERFADAAEYARHATTLAGATAQRTELLCLRGESLLRIGQARQAAEAFDAVLRESQDGPYVPQALFGSAAAHDALGEGEAAAQARARLESQFPENPWTRRVFEGR